MLSEGGVASRTRTVTLRFPLMLAALSCARNVTVCEPRPGKVACANHMVVLLIKVAPCHSPLPNRHSTLFTPAGLSATVPVIVATYGGDGRTTSAGGLMLSEGGLTSTVTDRDVSSTPVAPDEPDAVT